MPETRKYATAAAIFRQLLKADGSGFATDSDWTPGAGDVKVSLSTNGTTFASVANAATLPSYDATNLWWVFPLSSGELTSKVTGVRVIDATLKSDAFLVETFGNASALYQSDLAGADQSFPANFADLSVAASTGLVKPVQADIRTAVGLASANLDTQIATLAVPGSAMTLTSGERTAIGAALLATSVHGETVANLIGSNAFNFSIAAGVLTLKHADGTTIITRTIGRDLTGLLAAIITSDP